jgi:hypothetical protein
MSTARPIALFQRAKCESEHAEDRRGKVTERFSFMEGVALHPAATERRSEAEARTERAAEQPVGQRAIEEHPDAGRSCRGKRNDAGLPQANENASRDTGAETDHEATERMRPRFARGLRNGLTHEIFSVRVLDAKLGVVARLAQKEDHAAERGDEHFASEAKCGNEHRDRKRQADGRRGVECDRRCLSKTDPVDRSRYERCEDLQRRCEEHLANA